MWYTCTKTNCSLSSVPTHTSVIFLNLWGGVRVSPLGMPAISGPTVPAPDDR
jgi:hypothetical protein